MNISVPPQYVPILRRASAETGIPFNVLAAKLQQESGFRPDARGAAGEIGISQIMPATARQPGYGLSPIALEALSDPEQAIPWGARYLAARARGTNWADPRQAAQGLARYNGAGPQAQRYGRQVAQMAGMVVPPDPPTGDDGNAPLMSAGPMQVAEAPQWRGPQTSADEEATRQVMQMLRATGVLR